MKNFSFIFCVGLTLNVLAQNNPPIAVNDTFFVEFNDTLDVWNDTHVLSNDSDPDGNIMQVNSSAYTGGGYFIESFSPNPSHIWEFHYAPPFNFVGIDSIQYVIQDNGNPTLYDTATIYLFVKHKENEHIDLNNINASVGLQWLFGKSESGTASFEVPKGSGKHTIFAANLWLAGKHQDTVYMNSETFGAYLNSNSSTQFNANSGPIMDSAHYKKGTYDYKWDRFWKISHSEIQYHINNWNNANYQPIEAIKSWPAHGDVSKGQAANLAPFIDHNNDGIYNPMDGDYPQIKGQQAIYRIYNDMRYQPNTIKPMKTEVHYMVYAYHCPSDSATENTLFLDYTIYNRSNLTYDSTYIGMWTDFDLGNHADDYVGCDVDRSAFYAYNGDDIDQNMPINGTLGYGNHPPAQGVVFLKGAKQDDDGLDNSFGIAANESINGLGFNDWIADNEHWGMEHYTYFSIGNDPQQGDPNIDIQYYHYLTGKWKDGTPMVYGNNGHPNTGGTTPAKYLFPDSSDTYAYGTAGIPQQPWMEANASMGGYNTPGDRRGVGSTGPFTFQADSSISVTLAFVTGINYQDSGNYAGIVVMKERIDSIRSYYLTDYSTVCGGTLGIANNTPNNALVIYPNPFNQQFTVNYALKNKTAQLAVYNVVGKEVLTQITSKNTTVVDLSQQPNGFYFITITDGDKKVSQKIVKQ